MTASKQLSFGDIGALGFMTFAFFLGAGNIIFPPMAGQLAGENLSPAMFGFLFTAVGLPLLTLLAVARAGGGLPVMTQLLPRTAAVILAVSIYIVIGPAFATPRTGLVAFELGLKPFFPEAGNLLLLGFSVVFFSVAMALAMHRGTLIDSVGKILTPILLVLLVILAGSVVLMPQGTIDMAQQAYADRPFTKGFLEGYNTMDTFGALMFGMLIVDVLKKKGIDSSSLQQRYLVIAGIIAAAGLAFVYMSLFYLGATSTGVAPGATNGGEVLSAYVQALYGAPGQFILSTVVTLACLTTAVGLISACGDYFSELWPRLSYRQYVIVIGVLCAIVANVGLTQLIAISVPVLFALYPVAIALVVLTLLRNYLRRPTLSYRVVLATALFMALIDAVKVSGIEVDGPLMTFASHLPLFDYGLAWLAPVGVVICLSLFVPASRDTETA